MIGKITGNALIVFLGGVVIAALLQASRTVEPVESSSGGHAPAVALSRANRTTERLECEDVGRVPIVIAHRGASAFRPEHTLLSYRAAIRMGADYLELDLVSTKDHVLVARHENEISRTTDVKEHPEFAGRRTTKIINSNRMKGWFTEDFTLAELRTLRARERLPKRRPGNTEYDGKARIPTLKAIVRLAQKHDVGIYVEAKQPRYFASIGLPIERPLLETLKQHGWDHAEAPVFIQSFDAKILKQLHSATQVPLIQLIGAPRSPSGLLKVGGTPPQSDMLTSEGLRRIARYAAGIGVTTTWIVRVGPNGRLGPPTWIVRDAHQECLLVHAATIRAENIKLPADYRRGDPTSGAYRRARGNVVGWLKRLYRLDVDGVFADDPGIARATRDRMIAKD